MIPPTTDPADKQKADALDRWVQQQKEEAMRNLPKDLEVLPSPLLLEQMEREAVQLHSPPASLVAHSGPAVKPSLSSRRKKLRRGAPSCSAGEEVVSLPADVRAAASKPASSPATALSPRLAAAPPMPSSLTPARCSEATPEELEERLRFFARQIKTFRRTSLMYSSPELMERIGQMERDYETAVRQFYCRPPSTPGLQGAAAAAEQSTPGLQSAVELSEGPEGGLPPLPGPEHLLSFLWGVLTELKPDTHHDTPQPDSPQPDSGSDPKSASTSSKRRRGRRKRDASVHATEGLGDASAPAHATEGLGDASAPAHSTEGLGDASAPAHSTEGLGDASAPAHSTEGLGDASAPAHSTEGSPGLRRRPPELCACSGRPPGRRSPAEPLVPPELCAFETTSWVEHRSRTPSRRLGPCFWPSCHGPLRPPGPEYLLSFLWGVLTELKPDTHHDTPQSDTPQPDTPQPVSARPDSPQPDSPQPDSGSDPKSASTSSKRRRGRRKRDASVHATEGLGDASAPAHSTEGSPGSAFASEGSQGLRRRPPELCACSGRPPGFHSIYTQLFS
ncbi:hypothetical protein CRENBAI_026205 [Crenichthys baileyi]|uniref:AT-hook transcription factor n=1 Tax=Crenichthys baileyi TaxID=28760 RepID=A0AAV9QVQ4_9TELE